MMRALILCAFLAVGLQQIGQGLSVQAKAWLGQVLLERAWVDATRSGQPVEPWPGAVGQPVARLKMPRLGIDHLVLDSAETPVLAWGPGLETGPGGQRLIAAHRDTHFRFLEHVTEGDRMVLETMDGASEQWQVVDRRVVDARTTGLDMTRHGDRLTLVTCYPFEATQPGGPLRLIVTLKPVESG